MNFNKMFKLIVASTALIFTTIGFSHSASMPCGTAKLIVPWGAGGGTDVIFRQMVDKINNTNGRFKCHLTKNLCACIKNDELVVGI